MEKHYVYKLESDVIEHIGHTSNVDRRYNQHVYQKPNGSSCGKFYGRTDLKMVIVKEFDTRKEAYWYQCELQKQNGFKEDYDITSIAGKKGGHLSKPTNEVINNLKTMMNTEYKCDNCGRIIKGASNYSVHIKRNLCKPGTKKK